MISAMKGQEIPKTSILSPLRLQFCSRVAVGSKSIDFESLHWRQIADAITSKICKSGDGYNVISRERVDLAVVRLLEILVHVSFMSSEAKSGLRLEIGHVLFIDIVGYSTLLLNEQSGSLAELNDVVRGTEHFRSAEADGRLRSRIVARVRRCL